MKRKLRTTFDEVNRFVTLSLLSWPRTLKLRRIRVRGSHASDDERQKWVMPGYSGGSAGLSPGTYVRYATRAIISHFTQHLLLYSTQTDKSRAQNDSPRR